MKKPKFNLGGQVYHITPESEVGIIIDIVYYYATDKFRYLITLSFDKEIWCEEYELTSEKVYK